MPTLINTKYKEPEIFIYITEKFIELKQYSDGPINAGLYVLGDGFVYFYDGVYAITDSNNAVNELIIADKDRLGLVLIDTNEALKNDKQVIRKLEEFLTELYQIIRQLTKDDMANVILLSDRKVEEIKEELIVNHAV